MTLIQIYLKFVFTQTKKKALLFSFFLSAFIQKQRMMGERVEERKNGRRYHAREVQILI